MPDHNIDILKIGNKEFKSRLFIGTGKLSSSGLIPEIIRESGCEMITVALRRVDFSAPDDNILSYIPSNVMLLPNTSGARNCDEAVRIARLARESGCGNFIKIEVIHEMKYLMPDNDETIKATSILAKDDFIVLPYVLPDPVIVKKLEDAGAAAVMPLGSPIGSNRGIRTIDLIEMIIEDSSLPVVIDAGIGRPSHASQAMEIGADAVLINTAISSASDPAMTARAFSLAVQAGRLSYLAKMRDEQKYAQASSPLTNFLRS
jgi:thiazole synthase